MSANRWFLSVCICLGCSCTSHVIRQSVREIDRPLFLPARNWQASFGINVDHEFTDMKAKYGFAGNNPGDEIYWNPLLNLQWPSIHIGNNIEYYVPAIIRFYVTKKVEIGDNVERITGTNIAIVNGITGFSYSQIDDFQITTSHDILIKHPFSRRFWMENDISLQLVFPPNRRINYNFRGAMVVPVSIGYQVVDQLSVKGTFSLDGSYYYFGIDPKTDNYNKAWQYSEKIYDLDLRIPLDIKYVFNRTWELSLQLCSTVYDKRLFYLSEAAWCSFTW